MIPINSRFEAIEHQRRMEQSVAGRKSARVLKAQAICEAGAAKVHKFIGGMKTILAIIGIALVSTTQFACSTTANLTTTEGSAAATVDNPSGLSAGETVTSANTEVGTVLGSVAGSAVALSIPASTTGQTVATFKPTLAMDIAETGNIAADLQTDVVNGAVAYNDAQAALSGAQQAMGGHGLSLKNAGTYAQAASSAVNSSGLTNALATVGADITQQLSKGASLAQVSANVTAAQTSVTP